MKKVRKIATLSCLTYLICFALMGASGGTYLVAVDVSDPHIPEVVSSFPLSEAGLGRDITAYQDKSLLITSSDGVHLIDISNSQKPSQVYHIPLEGAQEVVVYEQRALISTMEGCYVIQIDQPHAVRQLPWDRFSLSKRIYPPYALFSAQGKYAYIVDKYRRLLRVDLFDPFSPENVELFSDSIYAISRASFFLSITAREYNQILTNPENYLSFELQYRLSSTIARHQDGLSLPPGRNEASITIGDSYYVKRPLVMSFPSKDQDKLSQDALILPINNAGWVFRGEVSDRYIVFWLGNFRSYLIWIIPRDRAGIHIFNWFAEHEKLFYLTGKRKSPFEEAIMHIHWWGDRLVLIDEYARQAKSLKLNYNEADRVYDLGLQDNILYILTDHSLILADLIGIAENREPEAMSSLEFPSYEMRRLCLMPGRNLLVLLANDREKEGISGK